MNLYKQFVDWVDPKFYNGENSLQEGKVWPLVKDAPQSAVDAYRKWLKQQKYAKQHGIIID